MNRINLISGPRNISTALMYSFGNRNDTSIVDEPMYAYYLNSHPKIEHPGKEEILRTQSLDLKILKEEIFFKLYSTENLFLKNMAHHFDGLDWSFLKDLKNVFLIRSPKQLIASFAQVIPNPTLLDIGLKLEYEIFDYLVESNQKCVVLDSNEVLTDPENVLTQLCEALEIPFDIRMLAWKAGARKEDGIWTPYWYSNVHKSTGFKKQNTSDRPFPERLTPLLKEAQYYFDILSEHSLKAN